MIYCLYEMDSLDLNRFGHMAGAFPVDFGLFRLQSARLEQYIDGCPYRNFFHLELFR